MKRSAAAVLIAFLLTGCVTGSRIDEVHAGMTPEQVSAAIGPPDSTTATAGRECSRYTVLKDFWSRTPWSMSDPYYVCYTDGKVDTFGPATVDRRS